MVGESMTEADAAFIAHHDPQWVFDDLDSKHGVITIIEQQMTVFQHLRDSYGPFWFAQMLKHLARPYARHPAFKPDWAIDYRG